MNDGIMHAGPAAGVPTRETPSQAITRAATEIHRVTDTKGRSIGFRRLSILERVRMFQIIGPEDAKNDAVLVFMIPAFYATDIDGVELPVIVKSPTAFRAIEARIQMLGDEGVEALTNGMAETFGAAELNAADSKN